MGFMHRDFRKTTGWFYSTAQYDALKRDIQRIIFRDPEAMDKAAASKMLVTPPVFTSCGALMKDPCDKSREKRVSNLRYAGRGSSRWS